MELSNLIILIGLFLYFKTLLEHTDDTGKMLVYGNIIFFLMIITLSACQLMYMESSYYHMPYSIIFDLFDPIKKRVNVQQFVPKQLYTFNPYSPKNDMENAYPLTFPLKYY